MAGFWGRAEPWAEAGVSVQDSDFLESIWDCSEVGFGEEAEKGVGVSAE